MTKHALYLSAACLSLLAVSGMAQEGSERVVPAPIIYEEVLVTGGRDAIRTLAGSASFIDEDTIRKFDSTDLNELLGQVPGVYIRFEDGYGLRPNIGIRGATTERSQKITLMEDGMLIAPAPYSAPAAYYVPNVNRMAAVEVFKGPAAIEYGPHTVGGAVNLVTPTVPEDRRGEVDVAFGSDGYNKARFFYGDTVGQFGYSIDVLHFGADGFKDLDGSGDTGFDRNDVNLRVQWRSAPESSIDQTLDLKLGFANEDSDETYLGLTDEDFDRNENRRYIGSERDEFDSTHTQAHLLHNMNFENGLNVFTTAYINRFDRAWDKYDGFIDGPDPSLVLAFPDIFVPEIELLRGERVSDPNDDATILDLTNNDREYGSHGIEVRLSQDVSLWNMEHTLSGGVRFHHDYVDRDHKIRGFLMTENGLEPDGQGRRGKKIFNEAETDAWSGFLRDEFAWGQWKFNAGLRYEYIEGELDDRLNDKESTNSESILMPGGGVFYQWTDRIGFLAGINKGFSPAGPAAGSGVDPEESINYEYGVRYTDTNLSADLIGFFSDYSNLLGRCRASDPGCDVGDEFNGGAVEVSGAEFTMNYTATWRGWVFPVNVVYTYTESSFQDSFQSGFSQWGLVRRGDELPYTPEHQGRFQIGASRLNWSLDLAMKYIGKMREIPGQGGYDDGAFTRALTTWDLAASYELLDGVTVKLVGENITDEREIVSRRPFGARPNQPRTLIFGVNYQF